MKKTTLLSSSNRKDIPADAPIVKYGEHIGHAARDIKQGEHVHEHNVKSVRENLG